MTTKMKELISVYIPIYSRIKKRNNSFLDKYLLHSSQQNLSKSTENAKNKYFSRISEKLNKPNTSTKCYWSLIKALLNKVASVPLIYDNNRYVTDLKEKCQLFNSYFSKHCILLKNIGIFPNTCSKHTNNILDTITFSKEDIR